MDSGAGAEAAEVTVNRAPVALAERAVIPLGEAQEDVVVPKVGVAVAAAVDK